MLRLRRFLRSLSAPEPDRLSVTIDGQTVEVALRRRDTARRMTLRVSSATGEVVLTLPPSMAISGAQSFLDAHTGWVAQRLSRLPDRILFRPGALIPVRGVPHRIVHWSRVRGATHTAKDVAGVEIIAVCGDEAGISGRVRRFLSGQAEADLRDSVLRHSASLDVVARRLTLRDTRSRWGSCSSSGALSFSWRLILAPPFVLDYLAAHEVAHLKEMNHSPRFWRLVYRLCARTEEAERWLNRNGSDLHRYG